jgi:GNAT superfamily N-acetyltransferase
VTTQSAPSADDVKIRPAGRVDAAALVDLGRRSLGWAGDENDAKLFAWKHFEGPWGPSAMWVATVDGRIVGFRAFVRWQFVEPSGEIVRAVRAVDTATDPEHQGQGIFTRLTLGALDALGAEGNRLVFNTPNRYSLSGYLKMGWRNLGRLPVAVRPARVRGLPALLRARVAASRWSLPSESGEPAAAVVEDAHAIARLLADQPVRPALLTRRTPEFLRWRYGFVPLHYRAQTLGGSPEDGVAFYRLRQRGPAVEIVVADVIVPGAAAHLRRRLIREISSSATGDYLIRIDPRPLTRDGFVRIPGAGPVLVGRELTGAPPPIGEWELNLGDVELL